eukprot:scaffold3014_cov172-Amphora_coffeaeformis.AAC.3
MPLAPRDYANVSDNVLFQSIKQSNWDQTRQLLGMKDDMNGETNTTTDESTSLSLVQDVDQYGNTPLHAALGYQAPEDILLHLLHLHPAATAAHGTEDWTPLHVASMWGCSTDVLTAIITANPHALDDAGQGGLKGRTPRHFRHRFPALQPLLDRSTDEWVSSIQQEQQPSSEQEQGTR